MRKLIFYLSAFTIAGIISVSSYSQKEQIPPPPPPKPPVLVSMKPTSPLVTVDTFYENNPSVAKVFAEKDNQIIIVLKNGTKEKYDLREEKQSRDFLNKYGVLPLLPPPPPPPPITIN